MTSPTWQHRPPYQGPTETSPARKSFTKKLRGACHCGRVVYWLSSDNPLNVKYCHCHDCQVIHGAPLQLAAIFEKADMAFERGVEGLHFTRRTARPRSTTCRARSRAGRAGRLSSTRGATWSLCRRHY